MMSREEDQNAPVTGDNGRCTGFHDPFDKRVRRDDPKASLPNPLLYSTGTQDEEEEDDVEQCLETLTRAQRKFHRDLEEERAYHVLKQSVRPPDAPDVFWLCRNKRNTNLLLNCTRLSRTTTSVPADNLSLHRSPWKGLPLAGSRARLQQSLQTGSRAREALRWRGSPGVSQVHIHR
ncbi:UNVERIFIED_CONTAM: hypothetical protein K2H54_006079 [Gekko kuhli]